MVILKWTLMLMLGTIVYMTGYSQGANSGWDTALKYSPECKQIAYPQGER